VFTFERKARVAGDSFSHFELRVLQNEHEMMKRNNSNCELNRGRAAEWSSVTRRQFNFGLSHTGGPASWISPREDEEGRWLRGIQLSGANPKPDCFTSMDAIHLNH
jgi:hypothetical protein